MITIITMLDVKTILKQQHTVLKQQRKMFTLYVLKKQYKQYNRIYQDKIMLTCRASQDRA